MPIPFVLIGLGAGAAALGVGKTIKAGVDQSEANRTNERAQSLVDKTTQTGNYSREKSGKALTSLGKQKLFVLNNNMGRFITAFDQIHDISLADSEGIKELSKLPLDEESLEELREMRSVAISLVGSAVSGAALGAVTAFGAYGGAMAFGAASTGTAIATLSGAAATNATLAFLGGGSLAVGGLGVAGGTAVLGGLVAGPALAVMGFVMGAKASANLDNAYSNLSQAKAYEEEVKNACKLCNAIRMRAAMFERLLLQLDAVFEPVILQLENLVEESGTDYRQYSPDQKAVVATSLSLASAIKAVMDTPILTEEGTLTEKSEELVAPTQKIIEPYL